MTNQIPSVFSIVSTIPYASWSHAALYRTIHATLLFLMLICTIPYFSTIHCARPRYPRFSALLCAAVRYTALLGRCVILRFHDTVLHCAPLRCCATMRSLTIHRATPRFLALHRAALCVLALHRATLRFLALHSATLRYSKLSCSILHSILFYKL